VALVLADSPFPIPYRVRSVKGVKNLAADLWKVVLVSPRCLTQCSSSLAALAVCGLEPSSLFTGSAIEAAKVTAATSSEVIDAFVYSAFAPSTTAANRSAHKLYLSICAAQCVKVRSLSLDPADEAILQLALRASKKILGDSPKRAVTLSRDDVHAVSVHLRAKHSTAADLYLFGAMCSRRGRRWKEKRLLLHQSLCENRRLMFTDTAIIVRFPVSASDTDISAGSYPQCSSELCGAHQVLYRSRSALSPCESLFDISRDSFSRLLATAITAVKGQ
ncbi:hypothetical protein FOZ62_002701, partial [Perkinsus olseni]